MAGIIDKKFARLGWLPDDAHQVRRRIRHELNRLAAHTFLRTKSNTSPNIMQVEALRVAGHLMTILKSPDAAHIAREIARDTVEEAHVHTITMLGQRAEQAARIDQNQVELGDA